MAKKKIVKKSGTRLKGQPQDDVQQLAQNLDTWAKKELPPNQRTLLQLLLSRSESREIKIGKGSYVIKINIDKTNIKNAVMDALAGISFYPRRSSTSGGVPCEDINWARSGYAWPRSGYIWPRSGWARSG